MSESSSSALEASIRAALADIPVGKGTAQDHVAGLTAHEGAVTVALSVPEDQSPEDFESVRAAAQNALQALPGLRAARVLLTQERKAPPVAGAQDKRRAQLAPIEMPGVRFRVAVASGKGGVGKSTLAANLAVAAAKNGLKVGLMDADIHGPSVPMLFGLRDARPQADSDKRIIPLQAHGVVVMSIGFLVPEETAVIWRGPMVQGALVQLMRDVAWENLDLLIMDMPPGTGDAALTLCQQANLSGAVVVATPQDLALADARKGLRMFERLGIPVLGLVENMSGFRCPHCGETSDIFGHGGVRDEARRLGTDLLAEIPLDPALRLASDAGTPLTALEPDSALGQIYRDLAQKVWSKLT